ncbi:MAG TPA: inositol monophosphatase [Dehalococcoidia bacterium]|nr:inositol monophosphatase [Dehalococcoidia bacterium]
MEAGLPSPEDLALIRSEAARLAGEAGELVTEYFRRPLEVRFKSDKGDSDPVTQADEASERFLREAILSRFPGHAVLGEEGRDVAGDASSAWVWVLDPVDGTTNYLNGLALFGVSVGVLHLGRPVAGAIYLPSGVVAAPVVVHAAVGQGAACADEPIVREDRAGSGARIGGVPGGGMRRFRGPAPAGVRLGEPRVLGSISYEMALVALGVLQYAIFARPRIWDVAAGAVIVREAGGSVLTQQAGRWAPLDGFGTSSSAADGLDLREWRAPVVAGDGDVAAYLTMSIPQPPGLVRRMLSRFGR